MANEITATVRLDLTKSNLKMLKQPSALQVTMTGTRIANQVQDIGFAAHELLETVSGFGTAGWCYIRNLDTTNFVQIGIDSAGTFHPLLKLLAGEFFLGPLTTKAVYAQADTAVCQVEYAMVER